MTVIVQRTPARPLVVQRAQPRPVIVQKTTNSAPAYDHPRDVIGGSP